MPQAPVGFVPDTPVASGSAPDEPAFKAWYAKQAQQSNLSADPDDPQQFYDYRAAFRAGATPDASGHWPSTYKKAGHPQTIVGGFHVQTGARVPGTPRAANAAELVKLGWDEKTAEQLANTPEPSTSADTTPATTVPDGFVADEPDFRTSNEIGPDGNAVVDPNTVGTFARHVGRQLNPVPLGQMVPFPKKAGGAGWKAPYEAGKSILQAHTAVKAKADEAWEKGDTVGAAAHYLYWLLPVIGPVLDQAGDDFKNGKYAAGLGDTLGLSAALFGSKALANAKLPVKVAPPAPNPNPLARAAVAFGEERGVPIDAGTATGSSFVKNVQKKVGSTWGGAHTAEEFQGQQAQALSRVGGDLADQAHLTAVTPETAGEAVRTDLTGLVKTLHEQANQAYGKLRDLEADPTNAGDVPAAPPTAAVQARMAESLGAIPTKSELSELRRIRAELDNQKYTAGKLVDDEPGVSSGSTYIPRTGNASVYHDIREAAPGTAEMTGGEMIAAIDRALETGSFTNAAKGAMAIARQRLETPGGRAARSASLPPGAGDQPMARMTMPVDLRGTKTALQPMYEALKRESELTSLMGGKAQALVALDKLVHGPDHVPVSVADSVLSDLKAMARGAELPQLRSRGQGLAARSVKELDVAVKAAVDRAGPDASEALASGRSATTAKYAVAELLEAIKDEPVQAYRKAVSPKDTAVAHLRQIQEMSPESMPRIGRAFLEELLGKATAEGGFQRGAGLQADWQRLGPQTKQLLYGSELTTQLDQFFLLAKKIGENPNPSGTAQVLNATNLVAGIPAYALAKMLYSPKAVTLLTRGLRTAFGPGRRSVAVMKMARGNVLAAAREAGVQVPLPKAAGAPAGSGEQKR